MFKNYLLTAFRQFSRNRIFTILNVIGLSTGMTVFILIMLYVEFEFSFDRYHRNSDRIYRIIQEQKDNYYMGTNQFVVTPAPLAPALKNEFPEVEYATCFAGRMNQQLRVGDEVYIENLLYAVDPDFFRIFSFDFLMGDPSNVLDGAYNVALSESIAKKYFGDDNPIGKIITFRDTVDLSVTGVFRDMPANSHFRVEIAFPFLTYMESRKGDLEHWNNSSYFTYFMLKEGTDFHAFEAKLPVLRDKYADDKIDQEGGQDNIYRVQPLTRAYLFTKANFDIAAGNNGNTLYIFSSIAIIILLIACINYMNMATAMASRRAKEVGIRKVIGAAKGSLVWQFLGESTLLAMVSLGLALVWVQVFLPFYNTFLERELSFNIINNPSVVWLLGITTIAVALFSGAYPALAISSFKPVSVLKGRFAGSKKGVALRNILVVAQFAISGTLILSTLIVKDQLNFIQKADMGYDRELIVAVRKRDPELDKNLNEVIRELKMKPSIVNVSQATSLPNNTTSSTTPDWFGKEEGQDINIYIGMIDENYLDLFNLELAEGRNFTAEDRLDKHGAFLINETTAKEIGFENPLDESLIWSQDTIPIVGVLKDFHQHSLHLPIKPLMYYTGQKSLGGSYLAIKIAGYDINKSLSDIEDVITKYSSVYPFDYQFFDDMFQKSYEKEKRVAKVINIFALITIIIASLGLYGLALFSARQRIKEVSIRKVLGASIIRIVMLLNRDFSGLILIAFIVASALSYYLMNEWLENFAFHVSIQPIRYLIALLFMTVIGWLTVGYQTIKAANTNPVDTLKEE